MKVKIALTLLIVSGWLVLNYAVGHYGALIVAQAAPMQLQDSNTTYIVFDLVQNVQNSMTHVFWVSALCVCLIWFNNIKALFVNKGELDEV